MKLAYYNEFDKYAAEWLRNLIAAGHIAPGDVDDRSIEDVRPSDLDGYAQCHFFAGVGVWSYALRLAGWPDDRPVWTGSCPCQPFSAAGEGAGFDDERHLWPAFHHLIGERRPAAVLGEQVASKDANPWIDLVCTDMEALGYSFGAVPFPSAGVGAPHIRDRLYWVADTGCARPLPGALAGVHRGEDGAGSWYGELERPSSVGGLADANNEESQRRGGVQQCADQCATGSASVARGLGQPNSNGCEPGSTSSAPVGHGDTAGADGGFGGTGPTNGHWRAADWLLCRDERWRPTEPGACPLVDGATARVGRLRAYGNAIVAPQAQAFIEAVMGV